MSRPCRFLLVVAVALLGMATGAQAYQQTTRWLTISIKPPDDNTPPLFLTNTTAGVKLDRYHSGDPTQQWAAVQTDYPTAPRVTGHGPLDGLLNCTFSGCPFQGHGGDVRKFVNRASGACLAFTAIDKHKLTHVEPCSANDDAVARQAWQWTFAADEVHQGVPPADLYTRLASLFQGSPKCMASTAKQASALLGSELQASACDGQWYQQFNFLLAAELACTTQWDYNICFVAGP